MRFLGFVSFFFLVSFVLLKAPSLSFGSPVSLQLNIPATASWTNVEVGNKEEIVNVTTTSCPNLCVLFNTEPLPTSLNNPSFNPVTGCSQVYPAPLILYFETTPSTNLTFAIRVCCDNGASEPSICGKPLSFFDYLAIILLILFFGDIAFALVVLFLFLLSRVFLFPLYLCGFYSERPSLCFTDQFYRDIRKCPNCEIQLEKVAGCIHVRCPSCQQDFLWIFADTVQASLIVKMEKLVPIIFCCRQRFSRSAPRLIEGRRICELCGVPANDPFAWNSVNLARRSLTPIETWILENCKYLEKTEDFEEEEPSEEDLRCPICLTSPKKWKLSCGHQFCKPCLVKCLRLNQQCPLDRLVIEEIPVEIGKPSLSSVVNNITPNDTTVQIV